MADAIRLRSVDDVDAALRSAALVPPAASAALLAGPTADLRAAMARFSSGPEHQERRRQVMAAIDGVDPAQLRQDAYRRAVARLGGDPVDALAGIGLAVPTEALATALGVGGAELPAVVADVAAVVRVIGRGQRSGPRSDRATAQLARRLASHPAGPVAAVSLLYQNHDATAALAAATILARHTGRRRRGALAGTVRVAVTGTVIGETPVEAGQQVILDLEASGHEHGAGPHRCPGADLAQSIVEGIVSAIDDRCYRLVVPDIEWGPDGRPLALPLAPPPAR
jgi:cytochrome P450